VTISPETALGQQKPLLFPDRLPARRVASGIAPFVGIAVATVLPPACAVCVLAVIQVGRETACGLLQQEGKLGIKLGDACGEFAKD
jgi:hypothetical protein